jgi:hypothetical protein
VAAALELKILNFSYFNEWQKYSQNTTIFISYEWVDHIAVYNLHASASIGHRQVVLLPVKRNLHYMGGASYW